MENKNLKALLDFVRRTNPEITERKLLEELKKCAYSTAALIITQKNGRIDAV